MYSLIPFRKSDIRTRFDSIFDQMWDDVLSGLEPSFTSDSRAGYPRIDVQELTDKFLIDATIPGLTKQDIQIEVFEDQGEKYLSISSTKKEQTEVKRGNFLKKEIHGSAFRRNLILPDNVNEEKIEASVKEGILTIEIPKKNETKTLPKTKVVEIK